MPVTPIGHDAPLPRSHVFISLAHGRRMRTIRVRTGVLQAGVVFCVALVAWLVGSTVYVVFHDDLMASMMAREARIQYAYEDRIASLRAQVDHEASLKLVGQSTLEGQVRELTQRAAALETRASLVAQLASHTGGGGAFSRSLAGPSPALATAAAPVAGREAVDNPTDEDATGSIAPGHDFGTSGSTPPAARKPRPEASLDRPAGWSDEARTDEARPLRLRLASVTEALEHVDAAQYARLESIGDHARRRVDTIRTALASAGLAPERLGIEAAPSAAGGPFVPLDPAIEASPFGRALDAMQSDVRAADGLTRALPRLPFARPLTGALEVTSPFGARLDPFLGRPAMHTGVDLRQDSGTDVMATAAGRVVSAGPAGGYGVMVEIDHGHGLSTRYAHLSAVAVEPGQIVTKGETVGEVGSTGRATGPHLHYETRIDGEAVDPERFLIAGEKLATLEALP